MTTVTNFGFFGDRLLSDFVVVRVRRLSLLFSAFLTALSAIAKVQAAPKAKAAPNKPRRM